MTQQAIDNWRQWQEYRDKVARYKEQDRQQAYYEYYHRDIDVNIKYPTE